MLAAVPLLLSLAAANVVPVAKRDEGSLIQRDASPFEIQSSKRDGFSIGADIASKIGAAINSTISIAGINNTEVASEVVGAIDKDLSVLKTGFEKLDPIHIGELIERSVAKLGAKFSSISVKLILSIEASIEGTLGISIAYPAPHL